jgi:ketoreductase
MRKQALITGATGGIGKAIARQLCKDGYSPILVARNEERLGQLAGELGNEFPDVESKIICCNVADQAQVGSLFESLNSQGTKIDVLVNGAGVSGGGITSNISNDAWLNVINTNLNSVFFTTREVLHLNLMPSGGRIINIASTGGKQGVIHGAPYSASKHGMVGFTKSLGLELARNKSGITVNAICPGFVETDMAVRVSKHYSDIWGTDETETKRRVEERVPLGRYIEPEEVAAMVSYLVTPIASGITAQAINVCGGLGNY